MILIISAWANRQVEMIRESLGNAQQIVLLDPHTLCQHPDEFGLHLDSGTVRIETDGFSGVPEYIYWNSRPRADAALAPTHVSRTSTFRSRLAQFVSDIAFAFESVAQSPGRLADIDRAESKIWLIRKASEIGLTVPGFTSNLVGKRTVGNLAKRTGNLYRKVLGSPCVVTEDGTGVTTTNLAIDETDVPQLEAGASQPWQYQPIVPFVAQIRSFIVGDSIWSARWEHRPTGHEWDMRYVQEVLGQKIPFEQIQLSQTLQRQLVMLTQACGLNRSAPELLELADGSHVFIDLNPCGDWMGVFPEKIEQEITEAIARTILS